MNRNICYLCIYFVLTACIFSCKKEELVLPLIVETASVDSIMNTTARVGGRVQYEGNDDITERGVFWGTVGVPEENGEKISVGIGTGTFYEILNGLAPGTTYYVKAYARNKNGFTYGNETYFTTQVNLPTVVTSSVSGITPVTAVVGGNVTSDGGFGVSQRGVFWGLQPNPKLTGIKVIVGNGTGEFSHTLSGLNSTNIYYFVAFATNIKGTSYGQEISFSTNPVAPVVSTIPASDISTVSAKMAGEIISDGGAEITEKGIVWATTPDFIENNHRLVINTNSMLFSQTVINLEPGRAYYFRAFAENNIGIAYGETQVFTTLGNSPGITVVRITNKQAGTVTLFGQVETNDLPTLVSVEYGLTSDYGMLFEHSPQITKPIDTIPLQISGLIPGQRYYFRILASNQVGTSYSNNTSVINVLTGLNGTIDNYHGHTYQTIGVGFQVWMAENLRSNRFNDGGAIPYAHSDSLWQFINGPAYSWYKGDSANHAANYGALYNWDAVHTGKLCPEGWSVPTDSDFIQLINYLIDDSDYGGGLKEPGTQFWNNPNTGADSYYGFNARGGGKRLPDGVYDYLKVEGNWWSSSQYSDLNYWYFQMMYNNNMAYRAYTSKKHGMTVRCVKNE